MQDDRSKTEHPRREDTEQTVADGHTSLPRDEARLTGRQWLMLAAVMTGTFLAMLNDFIVNVATPAIREGLAASYAEVQLVIGGYVLVYGLLLVTGGRLGDIHGPRRLFLLGAVLFTLASLACGLATTPLVLIFSRIVQAVGAALFYPQVLSVLQLAFDGRQRARAFAAFGATIGLASIAGQLLGGVLVDLDLFGLSWRPVFLINVPVGLAVLVVAALVLPGVSARARPRLDLVGVALATAALALLTLPLIVGRDLGWPIWILAMLVLSAPALALFLGWEQSLSGRGKSPLVPPLLFGIRSFSVGNAIALLFFAGNSGLFFLLPMQLQIGLGYSALYAGLTFTPLAAAFTVGSLLAPRLLPRLGNHVLTLGYAVNLIGNVALLITATVVGQEMTGLILAPALAVVGLGQGLGMSPLLGAALVGVPEEDAGSASGVIQTVMQIGIAFGVTVVGLVFFTVLGPDAPTPDSYTRAFTVALIVQPALALLALILVPALTPRSESERKTG